MPEKETIGYIGLGNMGMPMARNLLRAGHPVVVHDLDPARVRTMVDEGAAAVESPAGMASRASVIFSSLPTGESVEDVAAGPRGILGPRRIGSRDRLLHKPICGGISSIVDSTWPTEFPRSVETVPQGQDHGSETAGVLPHRRRKGREQAGRLVSIPDFAGVPRK